MVTLLNPEEREPLAERFGGIKLFQAMQETFKEKPNTMETLRFSPEDAWNFMVHRFDRIIGDCTSMPGGSGVPVYVNTLWTDIQTDILDAARAWNPNFQNNQTDVSTATAMVVSALLWCVHILDGPPGMFFRILGQATAKADFMDGFFSPLLDCCKEKEELAEQLSRYVGEGYARGERWSQWDKKTKLSVPSALAPPEQAWKIKNEIIAHFRGCFLPEGKAPVVAPADFERLVRAADYLVDNSRLLDLDERIRTAEGTPKAHVRYTVYLVYEKIFKQKKGMLPLLAEFLIHTFDIFQYDKAENICKHFAEPPDKPRKKKPG